MEKVTLYSLAKAVVEAHDYDAEHPEDATSEWAFELAEDELIEFVVELRAKKVAAVRRRKLLRALGRYEADVYVS